MVKRLPNHPDNLPDLGVARVLRIHIFAGGPPAVLSQLRTHVVEGLGVFEANLLPDSQENLGIRDPTRRLERAQSVPGGNPAVLGDQRLRIC